MVKQICREKMLITENNWRVSGKREKKEVDNATPKGKNLLL